MGLNQVLLEGLDAISISINVAMSKRCALLPAEIILGEGALALLCQYSLHAKRCSCFGIA